MVLITPMNNFIASVIGDVIASQLIMNISLIWSHRNLNTNLKFSQSVLAPSIKLFQAFVMPSVTAFQPSRNICLVSSQCFLKKALISSPHFTQMNIRAATAAATARAIGLAIINAPTAWNAPATIGSSLAKTPPSPVNKLLNTVNIGPPSLLSPLRTIAKPLTAGVAAFAPPNAVAQAPVSVPNPVINRPTIDKTGPIAITNRPIIITIF